ncbi:CBN-MIG-13 protein [Caenorhabditis brenneri]|uniref:CBN-MIG-13 protein n=1 Tax=Caenorhabditis brenneri TaxID=135651 RepID=G0M8A8_CAEBE|nr:CBN-MIG-13 protein [Caenorhabditis brenneri]
MLKLILPLIIFTICWKSSLSDPVASFFDGLDSRNECKARLDRRLTGFSGMLYSHSKYGQEPYNTSRNCVLMLVAPIGYNIRVRALQFDVASTENARNCEKDTLHIFDHETTLDPESYAPARIDDITSPGPIIGQFCGHFENKILNTSSHNALTLWWHSNPNGSNSKGFKLHWGSFRVSRTGNCVTGEFSCGNGECIPIESACDRFADCSNGEDLIHSRQMAANCQNIELDPLTTVSGVFVLLFSASIILSLCGFIMFVCCLCKCLKSTIPIKGATSHTTTTTTSADYKPEPPQFYPPSPPKMPPPSAASSYTPRLHHHFEGPLIPSEASAFHSARMQNHYSVNSDINGDYTYVRNDVHRNLL